MAAHLHKDINKLILEKAGGSKVDLNISRRLWPLEYDKYVNVKVRI